MTDINSQIAARGLQFLGKKMRGPDEHPVKRLVTACINGRSRPIGRPPTSVKHTYVQSLKTMIPDNIPRIFCETLFGFQRLLRYAQDERLLNR